MTDRIYCHLIRYPSGVRDFYGRKNIKNEEHEMEPGSYTNRSTFALAVATSLIVIDDTRV